MDYNPTNLSSSAPQQIIMIDLTDIPSQPQSQPQSQPEIKVAHPNERKIEELLQSLHNEMAVYEKYKERLEKELNDMRSNPNASDLQVPFMADYYNDYILSNQRKFYYLRNKIESLRDHDFIPPPFQVSNWP